VPAERKPTLVVVSGPPRSGKGTAAHAIARALPCPAICRDEIKEGMVHAHRGEFTPASGDPLTQRTLTVFFELLGLLVAAGVSVVAEAAFVDQRWRSGLDPLLDLVQLRIVQCRVDPAIARERRRVALDAGSGEAHAQLIGEEVEDWAKAYAAFERLSIDAPSIAVDTTNGFEPGLEEIVAFINSPETRLG
jgi:predicted kinase